MRTEQLQLSFIEAICNFSEPGFTGTPDFSAALKNLSTLLNTSEILFASAFVDIDNEEISLQSYFSHCDNANETPQAINKFALNNMPAWLISVDKGSDTFQVTYSSLLSSLQYSAKEDISGECQVVPFHVEDKLTGFFAFTSPSLINVKQDYPACYNAINISLRITYELALSQIQKHTYQTVLDLMPQRVFWKNRNSVYLGCNKAFSEDASLSGPASIIGKTDFEVFPEQANLYRSDDANTMQTREHLINAEEPQTQQSGETIWLRTSKRPIITKEDSVVGVVGTYDDISELKNIQHELNLAKTDLETRVTARTVELTQANQKLQDVISELKSTQDHLVESEKMAALGHLVAGISHEINTPIGIALTGASHLEGLSHTLKESVLSAELSKTEFLKHCDSIIKGNALILNNLERAAELIRNFKKIAVDQSNDGKRTIVFKDYLHEIINAMSSQTKSKLINVSIHGDSSFTLSTYPGTIAQIFTNLVTNTVFHALNGKQGGDINISFESINDQLQITFEDNGKGIAKDVLSKIFLPFYTTNRVEGGAGLGLSIVFNLVTQNLKGKITCESQLGHRTCFTILLPLN